MSSVVLSSSNTSESCSRQLHLLRRKDLVQLRDHCRSCMRLTLPSATHAAAAWTTGTCRWSTPPSARQVHLHRYFCMSQDAVFILVWQYECGHHTWCVGFCTLSIHLLVNVPSAFNPFSAHSIPSRNCTCGPLPTACNFRTIGTHLWTTIGFSTTQSKHWLW